MTDGWEDYRRAQAGAWLEGCRSAIHYERTLREQADAQLEAADGLRGLDYSRVTVSKSRTPDAIADAVADHIELAERIASVAEDAKRRLAEAHAAVSQLDGAEAECLTLYYLDERRHTWDWVAGRMNYSLSRMYDIRAAALLHAYDVMPARERDPRHPAV
jgi:hypothetical protein